MIILGIDPGLRCTGYGAIDVASPPPNRDAARNGGHPRLVEAGVITPDAGAPLERRLRVLNGAANTLLASLKPDVMVVEELWTAYKNPTTAVLMGHARGVLCLAAAAHDVPVRHLAHSLVKRALVGSGSATKERVKRMVMTELRLTATPQPDDVSDALALALAWANVERAESRFAALGVALGRPGLQSLTRRSAPAG